MLTPVVLALGLSPAAGAPRAAPPHPKLVVVITVDQLRADYLVRWRQQLTGGFFTLLADGAGFTNAFQDHAVTETAPGPSALLSGPWPAHTGMIRNTACARSSPTPLLRVLG